jgi:dsDNA-specific endonuclease/ATPase MutS2
MKFLFFERHSFSKGNKKFSNTVSFPKNALENVSMTPLQLRYTKFLTSPSAVELAIREQISELLWKQIAFLKLITFSISFLTFMLLDIIIAPSMPFTPKQLREST